MDPNFISLPCMEWVDRQWISAEHGGALQIGTETKHVRLDIPPKALLEDMSIILFLPMLDVACVEVQRLSLIPEDVVLDYEAKLTLEGDFHFAEKEVYLWRFGENRGEWEQKERVAYDNHPGGLRSYIGTITEFSRWGWGEGIPR